MTVTSVMVAYNEYGRRIGETHHRARIPNALVEQMRDLHEYGGKTPKQIAAMFDMSLRTVQNICYYQKRVQEPSHWKRVPMMAVAP